MCRLCSVLCSCLPRRVSVRLAALVLCASGVAGWALPTYLTAKQLRGQVLSVPDAAAPSSQLTTPSMFSRPLSAGSPATTAEPDSSVETSLVRDGQTAALVARRIHELEPGCPDTTRYAIAQSVARWSRNNGLPWQVVTALIHHESRFDPQARSRTGDHGLCQLHGRPIYDIDANVRAGCVHLAGCVAGSGSMRAALATYNGGPGGSRAGRCLAYADAILEVANDG